MKRNLTSYILFFLLSCSFLVSVIWFFPPKENPKKSIPKKEGISFVDEKDTLDVLLFFHASDIFVYRGTTIGFQHELLKKLEKDLKKNLRITIKDDYDLVYQEISQNNYDIIALDFAKTLYNLPFVTLSEPHSYSYPVVVTRKSISKDSLVNNQIIIPSCFNHFITLNDSVQISHLKNYHLKYTSNLTSENIFEMIEIEEIDYAICDYNIAITLLPFYSNLTILTKAGPEYERCWILNAKNGTLNFHINQWLNEFKQTTSYKNLQKKYFSQHSSYIKYSNSKSNKHRISEYDPYIKKYAQKYDVDWRFAASIIYQECKFVPDLIGYGGSFGLMQMMPITLEYYGIDETATEEEQICVGVKHIRNLKRYFADVYEEDKPYFIAAAYNAGTGHIFDAQNLCIKYNENPNDWNAVSKYLILKSSKQYYNDPIVTAGYYPGKHSVKYASEVVERYNTYKLAYK